MTTGGDKRKMKTQIVAILAIIAVITTLITVSAVSNEEGYNVTPCDAIDISLENTTVTDFLNATNMTTVQVYNFKGYKGENTWMVQWSSSNRSLEVYVTVATGHIAGIEKITVPEPLKAWIVANYGDGTRVTSEGWRKLNIAVMLNTLAPLPVGYTKADITEEVVIWAMDNPDWTIPTPTLTPTAETKTWHSVITFTDRDRKKSEPFTIKGDVWRINYTVNPVEGRTDHSTFNVHVYPENESIVSVSSWQCSFECCNGTEYISKGNADYYIEVIASSNSWKLEVEDYY